MKTLFFCSLILAVIATNARGQSNDSKRYVATPDGFMMVLRQGDDLFAELEKLATNENIGSATFTGLGFVNVTFGFFNSKTKQFRPKRIDDVEMAGMTGSIAWKEGKPSIHAHGVVGDKKFKAYAGHILGSTVSTGSLEIRIVSLPSKLERAKDESIGADVLDLN